MDSIKEYFIKLVKRELHFEQFLALKDVSVTIEQGDVFGIVGLNGSGKSTLLKVISGILKPTKGTVKTVGTISPMIELGAGFDMDLTARENISEWFCFRLFQADDGGKVRRNFGVF